MISAAIKTYPSNKPVQRQVNPCFGGIYGIKGSPGEVNSVVNFIKKWNFNFKIVDIFNQKKEKTIAIATNIDMLCSPKKIRKELQNKPEWILSASKLLNSKDFNYFDFNLAFNYEIKSFQENGLDFKATILKEKEGVSKNKIRMVNFSEPLKLGEAIKKLSLLRRDFKHEGTVFSFPFLNFYDFSRYQNAINDCSDFAKSKIKGLKGIGAQSAAFETEDDKILKISFTPNIPIEPQNYDIPVFDHLKINLPASINGIIENYKNIFCSLQANAQSWLETKISLQDVDGLLDKIHKNKDSVIDFNQRQIGKIKNETFLLDSGCIKDRNLLEN